MPRFGHLLANLQRHLEHAKASPHRCRPCRRCNECIGPGYHGGEWLCWRCVGRLRMGFWRWHLRHWREWVL